MKKIVVVPIGNGDPDWMAPGAVSALRGADRLVLRTDHHPAKAWLLRHHIPYVSLDDFYESAEDFEAMYAAMAARLWELTEEGPVTYAIPDPLSDRSLDHLYLSRPAPEDEVQVLPGVSRLELLQSLFREHLPSSGGCRFVSAAALPETDYDPNVSLLVDELDNEILAGEVKLFLSKYMEDEDDVFFLSSDREPPVSIPLMELDRRPCSHLSAVLVPGRPWQSRTHFTLFDLEQIMDRLRDPLSGCPWDREQTHASLREYIVEEAWETVGAIEEGDPLKLSDELGDLLFQVIFQAAVGKGTGDFDIRDVLNHICRKMIRRHPHVFGEETFLGAEEQGRRWESIKRMENGNESVEQSLMNVCRALPSLKFAQKVAKKSAPLRPLPPAEEALARILEDAAALQSRRDPDPPLVGDLLMACALYCQLNHLDAEILLREAANRFRDSALSGGDEPKEE